LKTDAPTSDKEDAIIQNVGAGAKFINILIRQWQKD
jgi:hypothetical protein